MEIPDSQGGKPSVLKMILNQPISAWNSSLKIKEISANIARMQAGITDGNSLVDDLFNRISSNLDKFAKDESRKDFLDTETKVLDFTRTILDQYKKKRSEEGGNRLAEEEKTLQLERESLLKAIESFLISDPDLFALTRISIKWNEGHYEGKAVFNGKVNRKSCENASRQLWKMLDRDEVSVIYEFSLKSSSVELFSGILRIGDLKKGLKIPIGSAVGWASKEAVINFEKVDKYYLSSAEISDNSTSMILSMDETNSSFTISYSDYSGNSVIGLSYRNEHQNLDIMANSVLSNSLDSQSIMEVAKIISDSVRILGTYKNRLLTLSALETDVITTLDAKTFMKSCVALYHCGHVRRNKNKTNGVPPLDLSKEYINERLQILGKDAADYSQLLGIS